MWHSHAWWRDVSRSKWIALVLATAVVGGLSTLWAVGTKSEVEVTTANVTTGTITRSIAATGTLQAVTTVEVGAQVSGNVQSLEADYNSLVRTGQVVARLDPSTYEAQLQGARAALAQAEAARGKAEADVLGFKTELEDAQTKDTRAAALAAKALVDPADLDAARIAVDEARADLVSGEASIAQATGAVAQARAAVDQATINLSLTVIRSPINGIVIDREVEVGQTLASSMTAPVLFRIAADLRKMQVQVEIDESDIGGLKVGEPALFTVEAYPNEKFTGTISQVRLQPVLDQGLASATNIASGAPASAGTTAPTVVSYTAVMDVVNADERLRPGMTAEVTLNGSKRVNAMRIPNTALTFRPSPEVLRALGETEPPIPAIAADGNGTNRNARAVWTYDGKRFTPIAIRDGVADSGWTELLTGSIKAGDALVTSAVEKRRPRL